MVCPWRVSVLRCIAALYVGIAPSDRNEGTPTACDTLAQHPNAERDGRRRQWRAHFEVRPEADLDTVAARALDDDEVRHRAQNGEIAGERRRHGERQPGRARL